LNKKPGAAALIAILIIIFCGAFVPVAQVVEPRFFGPETQTATVQDVGSDSARRASRRGQTVDFVLPDGTEGEVYLTKRWNYPEPGETIEVYRERGSWATPQEFSWGRALVGLGVGAFGILLLVGWFVMRRQADRAETTPALSDDERAARIEAELARARAERNDDQTGDYPGGDYPGGDGPARPGV